MLDSLLEPHLPNPDQLATIRHRLNDSSDRRLGKLFELLLELAILAQPHLEPVAHNIVVSGEGRTLGELDLIIRDLRSDAVIHVEATLKFYLGLNNGHFPGPNPSDTLAIKYQRLADHQLPLLHHPATLATFRKLGLPDVTEQHLFTRGRLFYTAKQTPSPPPQAWPGHERGLWWRASALPAEGHWQILSRPQWLTPPAMSDSEEYQLASNELVDYVQAHHRPTMVVRLDVPNRAGPAFVVPDQGWPDQPPGPTP